MDGVVVIDKPQGPTSHDVVWRVKKLYCVKKAGHTGTLDPLATGILPVCLGRATKAVSHLMAGEKTYEVDILFGVRTATLDLESDILERRDPPSDLGACLERTLPLFIGPIDQRPPYYSARKYRGRPLYQWAREGHLIDLPPHRIEIRELSLISIERDRVRARITCSKGTYIRSICEDMGRHIGCGAVMAGLRRTATGGFGIENAVRLQELEETTMEERLRYLIPLSDILEKD